MDRRNFLRSLGLAPAMCSLASPAQDQALVNHDVENGLSTELQGAHYFAGPWRLRIDSANIGKAKQWYLREPVSGTEAISVNVPSCWQEYAPGFAGGVGWYFKEFALPAPLAGRVLTLKFSAVDYFTEVWLNGSSIGSHEGGFTPFEFDVTGHARTGAENRLVVRVVDPPRPLNQSLLGLPGWEGTSDGVVDGFKFSEIPMGHQSWQEGFNFGGIWQPVQLLDTDPVYISDLFIEPKFSQQAVKIHVEVTNKQKSPVQAKIQVRVHPWKDASEATIHSEQYQQLAPGSEVVNLAIKMEQPHAWSPDDPFLYAAQVSIEDGGRVRDQRSARFGMREFSVRDGYFELNGKRLFIKGGHHQGTYPTTLEFPPTREFAYQEVKILKEAGFNFCRLWVKPAPLSFLDAADELGLLLQEEPPLSVMEDSPWMRERSLREVREMVKRDRNRPSIVIWNMINEADQPMKYVRDQCVLARELDPSRLITESAGGPTHYYVPYSKIGVSYLDEHPYPGGPLAEDVYDYNRSRGIVGKLAFFSEFGFGGMNDVESVLAKYGPHPKRHMEDYAGHVRLKQVRDKAFQESAILKGRFETLENLRDVCQAIQADTVRLQAEAMRCNPALGGYNYVQVFDSNAIEIDGLVDFWRDKRKKAFYAMQEANKPLLLVVRCSPMNVRAGEDFELTLTLINEYQVSGSKRLAIEIKSPSGAPVFTKHVTVDAQPWVSTLFRGTVNLNGESGRYLIEATLSDGAAVLTKKEDFCSMFASRDLRWPSCRVILLDPDKQLTPFLDDRGIAYDKPSSEIDQPCVIVVTPSIALYRRPLEYESLFRLITSVNRGCTALFLDVPTDGPCPMGSAQFFMESFFSPCSIAHITPFDRVESADEVWAGQRIGAYSWGLTDPLAGMPIPDHPVFEGLTHDRLMGREFGNVVPIKRIRTDWKQAVDTGSAVQIYSANDLTRIGSGKIIVCSLNLLPNLEKDALAEKLLRNLVSFAQQSLPSALSPEDPYIVESLKFQTEDYLDCMNKFVL